MVILLKEIESFAGNRDINNVEALVDEAFKSFHTISVEEENKHYQISEKEELIKHIYKLQEKGKKKKKTLILVLLLLCVSVLISTLLLSCDSAYHKETDKMITQCEDAISQYNECRRENLPICESEIRRIKTRELTQKQSDKVNQVEKQIIELKNEIEQERIAAQKEKEEQERQARKQREQEMKEWEAEVMDEAYRMGRNRGFQSGNDPIAPWTKKEQYLQSGMTRWSNVFYSSNRDATFYREKPDALPKAVEKYKQGYKDGYEEGWRMSH